MQRKKIKIALPYEIVDYIAHFLDLQDRANFLSVNRGLYHLCGDHAKFWLNNGLNEDAIKNPNYKESMFLSYDKIKELPVEGNTKLKIAKINHEQLLQQRLQGSVKDKEGKHRLKLSCLMLATVANYLVVDYFASVREPSTCYTQRCAQEKFPELGRHFLVYFVIAEMLAVIIVYHPKLLPVLLDFFQNQLILMLEPETRSSAYAVKLFDRPICSSEDAALLCELSTEKPRCH